MFGRRCNFGLFCAYFISDHSLKLVVKVLYIKYKRWQTTISEWRTKQNKVMLGNLVHSMEASDSVGAVL